MAVSNQFTSLSHCRVSQMGRAGGDVEGVEGKEEGSEPRGLKQRKTQSRCSKTIAHFS